MSLLQRMFGSGKKGEPTPQDAIQKLRETEEMLNRKSEFLEAKIAEELKKAKQYGTKNKRGKATILSRPWLSLVSLWLNVKHRVATRLCSTAISLNTPPPTPSSPFLSLFPFLLTCAVISHSSLSPLILPFFLPSLPFTLSSSSPAALQHLKRKKRLEKQLQNIDGTLSTIEFQREALENASTNTEVFKNMKTAAQALKSAQQGL